MLHCDGLTFLFLAHTTLQDVYTHLLRDISQMALMNHIPWYSRPGVAPSHSHVRGCLCHQQEAVGVTLCDFWDLSTKPAPHPGSLWPQNVLAALRKRRGADLSEGVIKGTPWFIRRSHVKCSDLRQFNYRNIVLLSIFLSVYLSLWPLEINKNHLFNKILDFSAYMNIFDSAEIQCIVKAC